MVRPVALAVAGFALVAVTYGLARFAYGLFLPEIRAEIGLDRAMAGLIAGGAFLGYCLAIFASAALTERFGARPVAVAAGLVAAAGMLAMALAQSPAALAAAVLVAGLATGLASPPLAAAVTATVEPRHQGRWNTVINAGTSGGVLLSGPLAIVAGTAWRDAYLGFALLALVATVMVACICPRTPRRPATTASPPPAGTGLRPLLAAAFVTGVASTAVWTFGADVLHEAGRSGTGVALAWTAIGVAGFAGAWAGDLIARHGIDVVHRAGLAALGLAILAFPFAAGTVASAVTAALLFGAVYVLLTGVYLVWGVAALAARPARGLALAFWALALGQVSGAPLYGALAAATSTTTASLAFAALAFGAVLVRRGPVVCAS